METKILHIIEGREGMEAHVAQIDRGYSVVLYCTESEMYVPSMKIFKTEALALAYAKTITQ